MGQNGGRAGRASLSTKIRSGVDYSRQSAQAPRHSFPKITRAAFHPAAPITPPPGCAAEPHRYSPLIGVTYPDQPGKGRITNSWLSVIAPWKMLPPVRLNVRSRSSGVTTCRAITDDLSPGAYSSSMSKQRSAKASLIWSQLPFFSLYGAYCTKMDIKCLPAGATVGSTAEAIVHSSTGLADGLPY